MKKIYSVIIMLFAVFLLASCKEKTTLYILNWAQYMSEEAVLAFEEKYNCEVEIEDVLSNEIMYTKIVTKSNKYDLAIPSDYMIQKLYTEGLLKDLDFTKLPNYDETMFDKKLTNLRKNYDNYNLKCAIPYFWGTLGIMYNTDVSGLKDTIINNGFKVLFEKDLLPEGMRVGMYDSSRDAVAAGELYLGYSLNETSFDKLIDAQNVLKNYKYTTWGTDDLKEKVMNHNLDVALVYSGDFFDALYFAIEDEHEINFDMIVPAVNNIWFDAMVIPTTSENSDLAHEFINYMLSFEAGYLNGSSVGYCPTVTAVYNAMLEDAESDEDFAKVVFHDAYYPGKVAETSEIYKYLGTDVFKKMDDILISAKGSN